MSQNFPRNKSVPASMDDDILDKEMDHIFHDDDREPLSKLNPSAGELDEERKNYYRSASSDDTATSEKQFTSPAAEAEPMTDQGYRHAGSEGFTSEHSNEDFRHKKSSNAGGKHRKSTDGGMKKASTAGAQLQGIPERDQETGAEEEKKSNFPWKVDRSDEPVIYTEENEEKDDDDEKNKQSGGVKFSIGFTEEEANEIVDEDEEEHFKEKGHKQNRHKKKTSRHQDKTDRRPSENFVSLADESGDLQEADLEEIAGHRFEKTKGGAATKFSHGKRSMIKIGREDVEMVGQDMKMMSRLGYGFKSELDHTPHALFIEMDELEGEEWEERARWIKYEEDLEAERGEWGKPHVSSLTFHSLINLRLCIESGTFLLDIAVKDLPSLVHRVVEDLSEKDIINEELKEKVLRVLLFRHKHVHAHETFRFGLKRSLSQKSIQSLVEDAKGRKFSSLASKPEPEKQSSINSMENGFNGKDKQNLMDSNGLHASSSFRRVDSMDSMMKAVRKTNILSSMEEGTEGAVVLVGALDEIKKPVVAFVRLAEAIIMPNTIEVSLPVRFIFILLTPKGDLNRDPHEIGRAFSTLMSNPSFAHVAYNVEEKHELLHAINIFLDDSVVLPPGDWDKKHMMGMKEIKEMRQRRKDRQNLKDGVIPVRDPLQEIKDEKGDDGPPKRNPMERTSVPFGGLIDDMKGRYPKYLSDFKDGLNGQCLAAIIFIYFACLSGGVAFGGLMAAKTNDAIGISETLVISCVAGVFFSLFSGCPLIIIGSTGPVLLFDEALFNFAEGKGDGDGLFPGQFLNWRTWVGIWTFVISLVVAGFQGSTLVKYFSRFIKDIFASLISLVFIYEAINKLSKIFSKHPLHGDLEYCDHYEDLDCVRRPASVFLNMTQDDSNNTYCEALPFDKRGPQPNTALLSAILMFGCFFIAYFLRLFRNSQYLGRNARKAMGDFGVPIAIIIMVLLDYSAGDTYTEKLKVPEGLDVTDPTQRGWFINPLGKNNDLAVWAMFAGFLPAMLLYLLLFIETHICELIMMEKTKDEKGAGLHLDIVILSLINLGCGLFGGPWICAATVRAVAHVSALTVFSASAIPGESPKAIGVRDQRVTFLVVSILLGVSIVMAPLLKQVPFAVLFGVFLYMGVSGMNGIQWYDRVLLCLMPVKHHPSVTYVKRVKTWRMVLFTFLQALGLALLWVVKSTPAALAFPIFVVMMIPYRWSMKFIFTEAELDALDGPNSGQNYDKDGDEEEDFYEAANAVPTAQPTQFIHKSLIGIVNLSQVIGTGALKPETENQKQ